MIAQQSLFGADNLAATEVIPPAPRLIPHYVWPYPGMSPEASAQAAMARTEAYNEMLAAVIKQQGGARLTTLQVLAFVPKDWRDLCGSFAHGSISNWAANKHGIETKYVSHDGGGFHFEYCAKGCTQ